MRSQPSQRQPRKHQHFYLVAGKVFFIIGDKTDEVCTLELNTLIRSDDQKISVRKMGQAQQALQMQAVEKVGEPNIQFQHLVLMNLSYLGYMTDEEFQLPVETVAPAPPEVIQSAGLAN